VVCTVAQLVMRVFLAQGGLLGNPQWITFLAGTGAIILTFLAGAELDKTIFKTKLGKSAHVGLTGFVGPFPVLHPRRGRPRDESETARGGVHIVPFRTRRGFERRPPSPGRDRGYNRGLSKWLAVKGKEQPLR